MPPLRNERSNPAKLDSDRADVGETAQSEARDHDRAIDQDSVLDELTEIAEGNQLVEHRPRAEKFADRLAVFPRHAQEISDGCHRPPGDSLERVEEIGKVQ